MGRIAAADAGERASADGNGVRPLRLGHLVQRSETTMLDLDDIRHSLQSLMWRNTGIERHGDRIAESVEIVSFWSRCTLDKTFNEPRGWEIQNMLALAGLVAAAALARGESRGVHFRSDCTAVESDDFCHHVVFGYTGERIETGKCDLSFEPRNKPSRDRKGADE